MKRSLHVLLILFILAASCKKQLIQNPVTDKSATNFYKSEKELEEAASAVYATLQFKGNYNTGLPAIGEIPGEDAYSETPANDGGVYGQLDDYNVISQSGLIADVWRDAYLGIQGANIVLNRIGAINYASEATKNARIGEMKFIRALYYFNLVRIFGDVPLVTEEITNPQGAFGQTRTNATEVYKQIEADLTDAISLLPDRTEANKGRVVKTAAHTLMGKFHLTQRQYAEAKTHLLAVVNSNAHELLTNPADVFDLNNELNREIIFAVQFASGLNGNTEGSQAYQMFNPSGRKVGNITGTKGHGVLKTDFYNLYTTNDLRKDTYVGTISPGIGYTNKIAVPNTILTDCPSDWVVLRYADVILMLAEIDNELGNTTEAITYLNMIRNRANIGIYTGLPDKNRVFNEIDLQRRKELVWEGHRWFDLLRQGRAKQVLGIANDNKLLLPLPASQIAADPALKQNPGY